MDEAMAQQVAKLLQDKMDEILQLKHDLRLAKSASAVLEENVQSQEEYIKQIEDEFRSFREKSGVNQEGSLRQLRDELTRKEGDLAEALSSRDSLQSNVDRLEKLLEEERTSRPQIEDSFRDTSICTVHEEEIKSLKEERDEALQMVITLEQKMKNLKRELMDTEERADDAMREGNMLRTNLQDAAEQLRLLEGQINDMKHNQHFASKGNSMFGEFVDREKQHENELRVLHSENISLRNENRHLHQEIDELNLQRSIGVGVQIALPCKCSDLEQALLEARNERDLAEGRARAHQDKGYEVVMEGMSVNEKVVKKRMTELRDDLKRRYVERDRLRRENELLKSQAATARVDMEMYKKKAESLTVEVDRMRQLQAVLRTKNANVNRKEMSEELARMTGRFQPPEVATGLQTPAVSSRASRVPHSSTSSISLFTPGRSPSIPPFTPSISSTQPVKRPIPKEFVIRKFKLPTDVDVTNDMSHNSSLNTTAKRKPRLLQPKVISKARAASNVTVVKAIKNEDKEDKDKDDGETRLGRKLRDVTPPDENDEKSNTSSSCSTITNDVHVISIDNSEGENMDPSMIMSKERMVADYNLEATVLEDTLPN